MEMTPKQIHEKLIEMGVSNLDAELVVNCINRKSAYTWLNTDPITREQVRKVNEFIMQNSMGVRIELSEVPYQGKYIWDVKVERRGQADIPVRDIPWNTRNLGPPADSGAFQSSVSSV